MVTRCLLVLALVAARGVPAAGGGAPGLATSPPNSHAAAQKYQAWRSAAAAVLIARADANSLATAAALRFADSAAALKAGAGSLKPVPSALDLAARAGELAPQSPSIGWLHLQLCAGTPSCDIRDVATVMRWVDADNGAAWLQTLAAAQKDRDTTDVDRILADMALGARFDLYWNRIVVLMVDALTAVGYDLASGYASSDSTRLNLVSGIASGEFIPPFSALAEACRDSSAPERREPCLKLSKTMQRSDTVAAQLAGFSLARHLLAPDSKEARAAAERRHVLEWRVAQAAKFDSPLLPWTKNARARARLAQMRALPREEDVCIAILKEHKVALDPPPEVHP
jgi:hypothetical protein